MSLATNINEAIKQAMLAKQEGRLRALRAIKSAILLAQSEKGATSELSTEKEIQVLQKLVKQRKDALEIYTKENRADLADKETEEINVIEGFLPAQLTDEELKAALLPIIQQVGATQATEAGKVMGVASKAFAGKADGKRILEMVKTILS